MAKRIVWICVIILIGVGIYYAYKQYQTRQQGIDGAVICTSGCETPEEKARFDRENHVDTPDGNSEHRQRTARQESSAIEAGFPAGTGPVPSNDAAQPNGNNQAVPNTIPPDNKTTNGSLALSNNSMSSNRMSSMSNNAPEYQAGNRQPTMAPVGLPMSDSRPANAPNGMAYAGSGSYQWYRQGNLTWRIDTATGHSCIIYATLEEWQKRIVYSNGCGRTS